MFKIKDTKSALLRAFCTLFNEATSNIDVDFEVYISLTPNLVNEVNYSENQIIIKDDFKNLIDTYGVLGGFSIISERLFKGLHIWLMHNFNDTQVEEQFLVIKNEIISKFKIKDSSFPSNYLKFLFYKDGLIEISSKEVRNILVNQHFYGTDLNLIKTSTKYNSPA